MIHLVHLTSSRFLGGPERQIIELAVHLPLAEYRSTLLSFSEQGHCRSFITEARQRGLAADALEHDTPRLWAANRELAKRLRRDRADVLCCHGYKANLIGRLAARRLRIPVIAVSRGWTGESFKVRLYEALDRRGLRRMDRIICVSAEQARRVRRCGVDDGRIAVIRNSVRFDRFRNAEESGRAELLELFFHPPEIIVGAVGRLSPEKGFDVLLEAARHILADQSRVGFVVFGEGIERTKLQRRIDQYRLSRSFILGGYRPDLDRLIPHFDLLVLPSYTEGLPNVVLEAMAAGVPVVATSVGGTPEVVEHGASGLLVPPGDVAALAAATSELLTSAEHRKAMGNAGRDRVLREFGFQAQAIQYQALLHTVLQEAS